MALKLIGPEHCIKPSGFASERQNYATPAKLMIMLNQSV